MAQPSLQRMSAPQALGFCVLNWLIPGAGFIAAGDRKRGVILMVLVNISFLIGLLYGGYVLAPAWSLKDPGFNIVNILTYLTQAFNGGGWLLLQALHGMSIENPESLFNLQRMSAAPYSDLGLFHLVVAGGLNYFATVRLYDLLAGTPELTQTLAEAETITSPTNSAKETS